MSVQRSVEYTVTCDHCGQEYDWHVFSSVREAVESVVEEGWTASGPLGRTMTCPDCGSEECK